MYDIIFLSHRETLADKHWNLLLERAPRAMRSHGVDGIVAAHQQAATLAQTRWFWVVDADNVVAPGFDFSFRWPINFPVFDAVGVWRARNNVNGLSYGYGGIKLLPREAVLDVDPVVVDFTTSIGANFRMMPEVASTTVINGSPFEAWRAGFREVAKVSSKSIAHNVVAEDEERIDAWLHKAEGDHADLVMAGAREGLEFGTENSDDSEQMLLLNNYDWLEERFERR